MHAKAITAVAGAAVCVGLAVWVGYQSLGGARTVRSAEQATGRAPRAADDRPIPVGSAGGGATPGMSWNAAAVEDDGPAPPWVLAADELRGSFDFATHGSPADAGAALDAGVGVLEQAARSADMGNLDAVARSGLVADWTRLVRPAIAGDRASFDAELARLDPTRGDDGRLPGDGLWNALTGLLERASLDLNAARVRRADATDARDVPRMPPLPPGVELKGGVPMMTVIEEHADESGAVTELQSTMVPLQSLFPGAAEAAARGAPVAEVWTPARCHGSKAAGADAGVSVFFVRDARARRWVPLAMRLTVVSDEAKERLRAAMPRRVAG
jgi:hypothetical protein